MELLSRQLDWKFADIDRRAMTRWLRACAFSIVVAAGLASPRPAQADAQADEYRVKAAFLYKFGGYVEWPDRSFARADSPVAIGVVGADALADEAAQIVSGRNVNGRPVPVRRRRPGDSLAGGKGQGVVRVGGGEEGLELGSMINFVVVENKVRFDVAPPPSESDNLKISARLLGVARKVVSRSS